MARPVAAMILLGVLAGCAGTPSDPTEGWSAKRLYEEAKSELEAANFQQAIEYFETLEARYPFGDYALQTQLEIAYAYYKFGESDSAIAAIDRFLKLNPRHERIDYAYYLRGLANYSRSRTLFESYFPRDMAQGDQQVLQQAFNDFRKVLTAAPDGPYAADARQRMVYLRNKMAEHQLQTAEFYFRRNAYVAAANRLNALLRDFPDTVHTNRALGVLSASYRQLGLSGLAEDTLRVLAANQQPAPRLATGERLEISQQ